MTYEQIKETDKRYLTPNDVCKILGTAAYSINLQAKKDPSVLPFPIVKVGTRVKIPRYSFLCFCKDVLGMEKGF